MESSRGGPLTTFIMMLPLIVVPAIAMLKPADLKDGWASRLLSASDSPAADESAENGAQFTDATDEFEELFGDDASGFTSESFRDSEDDLFNEAIGDSLIDAFPDELSAVGEPVGMQSAASDPAVSPVPVTDKALAPLMERLQRLGATKTLWFTPGNQTVGFVAFFRVDQGMVSYRFESIANSQAAAVQDVMRQVQDWQRNRRQ